MSAAEPDRVAAIAHVTDHVAAGTELLMRTLRFRPRLAALAAAWLVQVQAIEDAFWDLLVDTIDGAVGFRLDQIGELLLTPRGGLAADADYRAVLRAAVLARKSNGGADEVCAVLRAMLGVGPVFSYREGGASVVLECADPLPFARDAAIRPLRVAKAGGVQLQLVSPGVAASKVFTFASNPLVAEADAAKGFADADPATVGGYLNGAVQ